MNHLHKLLSFIYISTNFKYSYFVSYIVSHKNIRCSETSVPIKIGKINKNEIGAGICLRNQQTLAVCKQVVASQTNVSTFFLHTCYLKQRRTKNEIFLGNYFFLY